LPQRKGSWEERREKMGHLPIGVDFGYYKTMKVKEIIQLIEEDGWYLARTRGSHRQFKHPDIPGLVTVPGKLSDDLAPGTANSILKQAGLK
jgi:predicted RNA binding protein YcfA (HicA-like mRNA interferase family)